MLKILHISTLTFTRKNHLLIDKSSLTHSSSCLPQFTQFVPTENFLNNSVSSALMTKFSAHTKKNRYVDSHMKNFYFLFYGCQKNIFRGFPTCQVYYSVTHTRVQCIFNLFLIYFLYFLPALFSFSTTTIHTYFVSIANALI